MSNEQELLQSFEGSQRRKATIASICVAIAIAGFVGVKLYQAHLRAEASRSIEIRVQSP